MRQIFEFDGLEYDEENVGVIRNEVIVKFFISNCRLFCVVVNIFGGERIVYCCIWEY